MRPSARNVYAANEHVRRRDPFGLFPNGKPANPIPCSSDFNGNIEVFDEVGQPIRRDTLIAICRCGRSRHSPFCDNAHRAKVRVTLGGGAPTLSLGRLE